MDGVGLPRGGQGLHHLLLIGVGEGAVHIRGDQVGAGIGVPHAGGVGAGLELSLGKADVGLGGPLQGVADHLLVLGEQIHHQLLGAPQEAEQAEGPLVGPPHDEHPVAHRLHQTLGGLQPVADAAVLQGVGQLEAVNVPEIGEDGVVLIHRGHVVLPEDNPGAAGLGQGGVVHVHHAAVVAVLLQAQQVALGHFGRAAVDLADVIAGGFRAEQEALGDHGQAVGHLPGQYRLYALEGSHLCHAVHSFSAYRRQGGAPRFCQFLTKSQPVPTISYNTLSG